jgi:hypothetical protein
MAVKGHCIFMMFSEGDNEDLILNPNWTEYCPSNLQSFVENSKTSQTGLSWNSHTKISVPPSNKDCSKSDELNIQQEITRQHELEYQVEALKARHREYSYNIYLQL